MICIISRHFEPPEVGLHRLLAAGGVFLGAEGGLVGRDLRDVLHTGRNGGSDSTEAGALLQLGSLDGGGATDGLAQIQAVAVRVRGLCYAVRAEQHLGAAVLRVLTGFR